MKEISKEGLSVRPFSEQVNRRLQENKIAFFFFLVILGIIVWTLFVNLQPIFGNGIFMLMLLPIVAMAYVKGVKAGLFSGIYFFIIMIFVMLKNNLLSGIWDPITLTALVGGCGLIFLGILVGYLGNLRQSHAEELNNRIESDRELAKQKSRIQEILDQQPDLICRFNQDYKIVYMNRAGTQFFHMSEDECQTKNILNMIEEKYHRGFHNYINAFNRMQTHLQPELIVLPLYNQDGNKQYFEWSVSLFNENGDNQSEYQAVGRDITIQHLATIAERENLEIAESLKDIAATLNSTLDFGIVLGNVLTNIARVVPHDAANIMLVENDHARMTNLLGYEKFISNMESFKATRFPLKLANLQKMADSHQPVMIADISNEPEWMVLEGNNWLGSYLGAPLFFKEDLIGFINLDSTRSHFFTDKHAGWLQAFADQAAIAIKNAQYYEEEKKRTHQFSQLNKAMRLSTHAKTISEILHPLQQILLELFRYNGMQVYLWEENNSRFILQTGDVYNPETEDPVFDSAMVDNAFSKGSLIYSRDFTERETNHTSRLNTPGQHSIIILPLIVDSRKLGFIQLGFSPDPNFSQQELELMQQFSFQLSLAVSRIQLINDERIHAQEIEHTNRMLEMLTQISTEVELKITLSDLITTISNALHNNQINCFAGLLEDEWLQGMLMDSEFNGTSEISASPLHILKPQTPHNNSDLYNLLSNKQTLFYENYALFKKNIFAEIPLQLPEDDMAQKIDHSHVFATPLIIHEQVIGFLALWGEQLQVHDKSALQIFSTQTSNAIEKARLYFQISQLALIDPLTGFYNRRGLDELGKHEIERSTRFSNHLSAIMVDIDHFKMVNDKFGHAVGDRVLEKIAYLMRSNLRHVDIICRFGGEEFFILLPEANLESAGIIAERLRAAIENEDLLPEVGSIHATISLGICQLSNQIQTLADMINCSDQALYKAKSEGRNKVYTNI